MHQIEDFSDLRQKAWCVHCGISRNSKEFTLDHVPSKSLLNKPLPANTPKVAICGDCNNQMSVDEEHLAVFLRCVVENTADPVELKHGPTARALLRNSRLARDMQMACSQLDLFHSNDTKIWRPDLDRIIPPLLKNARGHFYYELGERPGGEIFSVMAVPMNTLTDFQRDYFETIPRSGLLPEVGSRMMTRFFTNMDLNDNGWIEVQKGIYRYSVIENCCVRMVLREYLAFEVMWR